LTFGAGPDTLLTLNNKWTVSGQRTFVETAPGTTLIFRGVKSVGIAVSAPDPQQTTIFGVVGKKAYETIASEMGWTGSVMSLDEL
jgi:hypothetical protein